MVIGDLLRKSPITTINPQFKPKLRYNQRMTDIFRIHVEKEFALLRAEWDELLTASGSVSFFLSYDWANACLNAGSSKIIPLILCVREEGKLIGIAPFEISTREKYGRVNKMVINLGRYQVDQGGFLCEPSNRQKVLTAVWNYLQTHRGEWDFFEFMEVPESAGFSEMFKAIVPNKNAILIRNSFQYTKPLTGTWEDYLSEKSSKTMKKNLRYRKNTLIKNGFSDYHQEFYYAETIPESVWDVVLRIRRNGSFPDFYDKEDYFSFLKKLFTDAIRDGHAFLSILFADSTPMAFDMGFIQNGSFCGWQGTYDHQYKDYAPGIFNRYYLMELAYESGEGKKLPKITSFNFLRGAQDYKQTFHPDESVFYSYRIINSTFINSLMFIFPQWFAKKILHRDTEVNSYKLTILD